MDRRFWWATIPWGRKESDRTERARRQESSYLLSNNRVDLSQKSKTHAQSLGNTGTNSMCSLTSCFHCIILYTLYNLIYLQIYLTLPIPSIYVIAFIQEILNSGLSWWLDGQDSMFPMQGAQFWSLVRELDPACCN